MEENTIKDYVIIGWPNIQYLMEEEDFEFHATLINQNDEMGIDSCTYLVEKEWYNEF